MKGKACILSWAFLGLLITIEQGWTADTEICQPWIDKTPPSVTYQQSAVAGAAVKIQPPPHFKVKKGGNVEPSLIFLGDSLTQGAGSPNPEDSFPLKVISNTPFLGRKYEIYAIGGQNSTILSSLFLEQEIPRNSVLIIWIGRNNTPLEENTLVSDIEKTISEHNSSKYLVLSILRGRYTNEQPGTDRYEKIQKINGALQTAFGSHFVDVGKTLECTDRVDNIHLNSTGYAKIAQAVSKELISRSW